MPSILDVGNAVIPSKSAKIGAIGLMQRTLPL